MRIILHFLLLMSSAILCQEYKTYEEVIEYVNGKLDFVLKSTQETINRVSDLITHSDLQDTAVIRLRVCSDWRQSNRDDVTLKEYVQQFVHSVQVTKNSIDRLVMNGSRNLTAKCELITDETVFLCLGEATEEVNNISHTLLDNLRYVLAQFKQSICRETTDLL